MKKLYNILLALLCAVTLQAQETGSVLIKNGTVITVTKGTLENTDVLIENGKIKKIGKDLTAGRSVKVIDAKGLYVMPGIIDAHSHLGIDAVNEATNPVTAEVWAEHSLWTQDTQFALALKGGATSFHVLPGSANLFGGRGATFKNISQNTIQAMKFPGAPHSLKMACGENPKRVYGNRRQSPSTRMGNMAG